MSEKIAIGVIGTGNMGRNHVRVLQSMQQDYEFIGIYDADERRAATIADVYDTVAFTQLDALLERVDAVSIAVPSFLHKEIALQAAAAGCHVMLEKPIALNVKDAQAIIQACQQAGVLLMVGHVERFNPAIMELMKVIENEEIISLDFKRMSPYDPRIGDANVVQDLMIHDIDILNAIMGDAALQRLVSQGAKVFSGKLDFVQAMFTYETGILASITASRVTESKIRMVEINAKNAYIFVDFLEKKIEIQRKTQFSLDIGHDMTYKQENIIERVFVPMSEPLKNEFEHFAHCIHTGEQPRTNGAMALKALEICEDISNSAEVGNGQ